ncbi:MAG: hypothetical protein KAQ92_07730 [Candidatus Aenigmarchaeota archaeon]|nr:hypothetical protein [Candidatus Aenigmarchaeota archaeon]
MKEDKKSKRNIAAMFIYYNQILWFIIVYCICFTSTIFTKDLFSSIFGTNMPVNTYVFSSIMAIIFYLANYSWANKVIHESK